MADLKINLNVSDLTKYLEKFADDVKRDVEQGIKGLARATHTHILEEAKKKLTKFELPVYEKNLSQATQVDEFLWEITLIDKGAEIENGQPARDMKPSLLNVTRPGKKPAKTDKDGNKYRIIPMEQGKMTSTLNPKTLSNDKEAIDQIKAFLKGKKLSYSGLEKDPRTGSPRLSKVGKDGYPRPLHSFDIPSRIPGKGNTELLTRLNIYQVKNKNGGAKKVMTTFRTVKEEGQEGKWIYPAQGAKNIFSEAGDWAKDQWDREWLPKILMKYKE